MITLKGLRKEFAGTTALEGIDLHVESGLIHGIVGRSGAGKSTLIRCLTGLETPTSGTVEINGEDVTAYTGARLRKARRSIGMVFQHAELLDSKTALENIAHPLLIAGVKKKQAMERARELVTLVGLDGRENNHPAQLSGGQRQRVGIARALATEPKILLCDEPTSALDSTTTAQILALIKRLRDDLGITVLIITHEMSVVREICDSVTLLAEGRNQHTASLRDVLSDPSSTLARELIPLPSAPIRDAEDDTAMLEISIAGMSASEVFEAAQQAGTPIVEVEAAMLERIAGLDVGRMRIRSTDTQATRALARTLSERGIYVEEAA
ncbi:methionine ABC transporter ATP-binding protein [Pseudoglutamicibacter cumminsii]|uniref:Methionine ABC transporter ATP-binding protein n=1 Tax=Pseudoglutamicibacter cumminsii TaxID=156979 RepID=A0ABX5L584_9MICC|nr:ATP-binding cassette domain-containing protein [Pseudoglutamicibacter cumminsii]PWI27643.1 methionine ABC transporter ATP-binding protein [Pseudoglutamicibacter cumminsii]